MSPTRRVLGWVAVSLVVSGGTFAASAQGRVRVGEEVAYKAGTPRGYVAGGADQPVAWSESIVSPGATFVRVHFSKFSLPAGDFLTVSSPNGPERWTYTGRGPRGTGEFWAFTVDGENAIVELHSGVVAPVSRRYGVEIDRIARGDVPLDEDGFPLEKVICGTDGRENVACHTGVNVRPVARLSFQSGGSSFLCTGWLVAGPNNSTMMTNNHCFTTQAEVNTVQARFNYQRTTCTGSTTATTTTYAGGTFLKTNSVNSLDYTLFTLQGNPEATFGEYVATSKNPSAGLVIDFPQHSGGNLKTIAFWKDSAHTLRCVATAANQTISGATAGSQLTYSCDSEGGASGSPILDDGTGRVIAIHHFGGISSNPCLNSATQMRQICPNAGSLLTCATN